MVIPGMQAENPRDARALALVTQYEYKELAPEGESGSFWGKLPATMSLAKIDQDKRSGALQVVDYSNIDFASINGLWIPCAASLTPWNTHLGSEEYEPDAMPDACVIRVREHARSYSRPGQALCELCALGGWRASRDCCDIGDGGQGAVRLAPVRAGQIGRHWDAMSRVGEAVLSREPAKAPMAQSLYDQWAWHPACKIRNSEHHPPLASNPMFGLITRKDLLIHPVTVCRHYGWRVLVAGILRPRRTFLDLVARHIDD